MIVPQPVEDAHAGVVLLAPAAALLPEHLINEATEPPRGRSASPPCSLGIFGERSSIFAYFLAVGSHTPTFFAILAIGSLFLYISRIS